MALDETLDIGSDTRTPVEDNDYQVPFWFIGAIKNVTVEVGPQQLTAADHAVIGPAPARARD